MIPRQCPLCGRYVTLLAEVPGGEPICTDCHLRRITEAKRRKPTTLYCQRCEQPFPALELSEGLCLTCFKEIQHHA